MARHRTIKPEFCTSEQIVECSRDARLLFVLMWMFCDDGGVHQASVKKLKMECFPGDDLTVAEVEKLVAELIGQGLLREFEADGQKWWNVTGWHHQKIDRPTYLHPFSRELGEQAFITRQTRGERSASDRREDAEPAAMDRARVEKKGEEQKRKEGRGGERKRPVAASAKPVEQNPVEEKRAESTGAAESGAESKREESKPAEQKPAADHRTSETKPSGVDTAKGPAGGTGGSLGGGAVRAGSAAPVPVSNSSAGGSVGGRDLLIPERIDSPVMRDMWPVYVEWRRERGMDCSEVQLLKILGQINTELIAEPAGRAAAMAVDCLGMAMDRSWNWVFPKHVIKAEREREKREKEAAAGQAAADQQRAAYEQRKAQERLERELAGVIRQLRQQKRSDAEITEQLYASGVFPPEFLAAAGWKREEVAAG